MCDADNRPETKRRVEKSTGVEERPEAKVTRDAYVLEQTAEPAPAPEPAERQAPPQGGAPRL